MHTRHSIQNIINLANVKSLVPLASRSHADINAKLFFFYHKNIGNQAQSNTGAFSKVLIKGSRTNGLRAKISAVTLPFFFLFINSLQATKLRRQERSTKICCTIVWSYWEHFNEKNTQYYHTRFLQQSCFQTLGQGKLLHLKLSTSFLSSR